MKKINSSRRCYQLVARPLTALLWLSAVTLAAAAPLTVPTAVYTKPDATAPVIVTLPAGTETPSLAGMDGPPGWLAVSLPGPHTVFVKNSDLAKDLSIHVGAAYYLAAKADATVLAVAAAGDETKITNLVGKYTEFSLNKSVVGYLRAPAVAAKPAPAPVAPAPIVVTTPPVTVVTTPPVAKPASNYPVPPRPAAELPRLYEGTLASTRSLLHPRRPYDYELRDSNGSAYAYLDLSKLPPTESIERYLDQIVSIYGTAKNVPGVSLMVIEGETLRAR